MQNIGEVGMEPRQSRTNLDTREWSIIIPVWNLSGVTTKYIMEDVVEGVLRLI